MKDAMKTFPAAVVSFLLAVPLSAADLKLAAVFSDHAVLQRDKPMPVWGWADAGETVTVEFAGQTQTGTAGPDGKWLVKLAPVAASAKPQTLTARTGRIERKAADILVGEVWLGSGQSNMAMTVSRCRDLDAEKAAAKLPLIRMFKEASGGSATPRAETSGTWVVCSPETVGSFSATLYFFGRELHRELKVPVGLVNSSVGGTQIEAWVAAEAQARVPSLKAADEAEKKAVAEGKAQARRGQAGGLFNGKIFPLVPFAVRGILWYQGEANSRGERAVLYQDQLETLVKDWRARWGEELPIAWVQLPNFDRPGDGWSMVREGMLKALRLPKTGMAVTVDIGDVKDIHPKNKQDVGKRLALWALGDVYGRQGVATCGPLPTGHVVRNSEIVVTFTHTDGGLQAKDGVKGFQIAAADRAWKPAVARIEGDTVIVSAPGVEKPAAVRYAWASNPECNLRNGQGLPASPFRTDDWPVVDGGK